LTDLAAIAKGAGFANAISTQNVKEFEAGYLQALKSSELHFILAKIEVGTAKVPPAPLDSQENKYSFVRYIEKIEKINILVSPPSRAQDIHQK